MKSDQRKAERRRKVELLRATLAAIIMVVAGLPFMVSAATYSQVDNSSLGTDSIGPINNGYTGYLYQGIGTGFSGSITGLVQQFKQIGGSVINAQPSIVDCPSEADWLAQTGCSAINPISENVVGSVYVYTYATTTMNSADYYGIYDGFNLGAGPSISAYGSVSAITDGACYIFDSSHDTLPINTGGSSCAGIAVPYFQLQGYGGPFPSSYTVTQITSVVPVSGVTIATSTGATFSVIGYVAPQDFQSGMFVQMQYAVLLDSQGASASPSQYYTTLDFPITSSGPFDFSTTSPVTTIGNYEMQSTIQDSSAIGSFLNFIGFGQFAGFNQLVATSTGFTAVELNAYDIYIASSTASLDTLFATSTVGVNNLLESCNPFAFDFTTCFGVLFSVQVIDFSQLGSQVGSAIGDKAPWGYATQVIGDINLGYATTSTALPSVVFTLPNGYIGAGTQIDLTPWNELMGAGSILASSTNPNTGQTLQQAIEPLWDDFIFAVFFITFMAEIIGIGGKAVSTTI